MPIYNFSAGPSMLPREVLQQAADEMFDWQGTSLPVMSMGHRGQEFGEILSATHRDFRELFAVPKEYEVLFMQGGAQAQNALIPLNLAQRTAHSVADYVHTGVWSGKSIAEACRYVQVNVAASSADEHFTVVPDQTTWRLSPHPCYVHVCTNETIDGVEYPFTPDIANETHQAPLVADMSSHILSRVVQVSDYAIIYAGAQKNIGIAGLTIVVVRKDLLNPAYVLPACPTVFNWKTVSEHQSMFNTPPTYAIYIAGLMFDWLKKQGGVAAMEQINIEKAALLYKALDSSDFYRTKVHPTYRSRMNVPFFLHDERLNAAFLEGAHEAGLLQLKGHTRVGGMRASIYNAMPMAGVEALVAYLKAFEQLHG